MDTILKKHYIVLIITLLACLFALIVLGFVFSRINLRIAQTLDLRERLVSYEINKKAFNEEVIQIRSLQERIKSLDSLIVQNSSVPRLLSGLESLAEKNNIVFEITSVQTIIENDQAKLIIECKAVGSYSQVGSFFDQIQHQSFLIQFRQFALFSELNNSISSDAVPLPSENSTTIASTTTKWRGVATLEIISFK